MKAFRNILCAFAVTDGNDLRVTGNCVAGANTYNYTPSN